MEKEGKKRNSDLPTVRLFWATRQTGNNVLLKDGLIKESAMLTGNQSVSEEACVFYSNTEYK